MVHRVPDTSLTLSRATAFPAVPYSAQRLFLRFFLSLAGTAAADRPDGVYTFEASGAQLIRNFGDWEHCAQVDDEEMCIAMRMGRSASGDYLGRVIVRFDGEILNGLMNGHAWGAAKGKDSGKQSFKAAFLGLGSMSVAGVGSPRVVVYGELSTKSVDEDGVFLSKLTLTVSLDAESEKFKGEFLAVAPAVPWTLSLDVSPVDDKQLEGTATAMIGPSRFAIPVSGKYKTKSDVPKLKRAKGIRKDGTSLKISKMKINGDGIEEI